MENAVAARLGRPREFDIDDALENALQVFWSKGYEGSSLTDLTGAMGITKTSMYAAFGNKEQLFRKAVERYTAGPASYGERALEAPTARDVAFALLHGAVTATTTPESPPGCFGVQGALVTGEGSAPARDVLVEWRKAGGARLADRFERAAQENDLAPGVDPRQLAMYYMTVAYGIAVQAATGTAPEDLHAVADRALAAGGWAEGRTGQDD